MAKPMEVSEQVVDLILHKMHQHKVHVPKESGKEDVSERVAEKLSWVLQGVDKILPLADPLGICCISGTCMEGTEQNCSSASNGIWKGFGTCANYQCD